MADNNSEGITSPGAATDIAKTGSPGFAEKNAPGTEEGDAGDWSFLPETLRNLQQDFDKPEAFWTEVGRLALLAKEQKAVTGANPESLLTEDDWQAFWKRAGRPDSPEGYALPEKWTDADLAPEFAAKVNELLAGDRSAFMQACHACNLTSKQAESLFGVVGGLMAETLQREIAEQPVPEQVLAQLWPKDTEKHLETARRGARHAGLGDALDEAGLSANPLVLQLSRALGAAVGESMIPGKDARAAALPRGDQAREEMHRLIASDAYRNNDPESIRKVEALARRVDTA